MDSQTRIATLAISPDGQTITLRIASELPDVKLYTVRQEKLNEVFTLLPNLAEGAGTLSDKSDALFFVSAMGICIHTIAPLLRDRRNNPTVLYVDTTGRYVISVVSGHIDGANEWTNRVAHILGAGPVITTRGDRQGLWTLDTLGAEGGWDSETASCSMNAAITTFVNKRPVTLLLEMRSEGTAYLERTHPKHVDLYYHHEGIDQNRYDLLITVSFHLLRGLTTPCLYFRPQLLRLGMGCRHQANLEGVMAHILSDICAEGFAPSAITTINSIELKRGEPILNELSRHLGKPCRLYSSNELATIEVPSPSERVVTATGSTSVSEASVLAASQGRPLIIEKQKGCLTPQSDFTYNLAITPEGLPHGYIEIVGVGPGDPELTSVRGKHSLERADLILYAGSLVPIELTYYAKKGVAVKSSVNMDLEEQFTLVEEFYDKHAPIVQLHAKDPAIFGVIQEQMAPFDEAGVSYHITPGTSPFLAATVELRFQFTILERVQAAILTRDGGRTPMPEREQLRKLAAPQSTMCIYLSAILVEGVQRELLVHYPPTAPVAACYKLTWPEQRIYRGQLSELTQIVRKHHLTLTTLMVVDDTIDNCAGPSKLCNDNFKHLFRQ